MSSIDASSASKQEAIRSAKLKLKSYRAKQKRASNPVAHTRQISHSRRRSSVDLKPLGAPKRLSLQPQATHAHKRTLSRNASAFTFPPRDPQQQQQPLGQLSAPPMAPSASSNRRLSQQGRRHSRTESILDTGLVNGQFMPIPESWSFPPKSPGSAPPLSSSTSATGSPMSLAQQHQHQMMQRQPSNPPPVQSSSSNTGMSHARRGSRHSRQLSLATRRESMDLMAGLNLGAGNGPLVHQDPPAEEERDDPEEQRRGALDALEGRATPPRPTEQPAPEKKSTSTTAASAAAPPAETVAPISTPLSPNMFQSSFGPISNKRASWGPISMTPEPTNNPVSDLGSVMEEEEEEEGVSDLPVRTPVAASKRPRPTSLFFQPNPRRTSLLAENTTPSSASGGFPPTDSAISMRPDVPESPAPVREIGSRRGLKSLSLSMSPHSPASSPANASNNNSAALSSSSPASADQSTTKQQRRQSGLRSLTLSSQGAGLPSSPSLSEVAASPLSTVSASASAANASNSPLTNRRQSLMALGGGSSRSRASSITSSAAGLGSSSNSKRAPKASSISYRHNGEPAIASWQQRMAHTPAGTPVDDDDRSEWGANDSEFGGASESMRSGPSAAQSAIAALRSQVNDLQQEAQVLREELATAKALHASSTASAADAATTLEGRLAELQTRLSESTEHHKLSQGQLETELAEVRGQLEDAVSERDALADDVEGWRSRCADLTAALDREKQALDTEKKDGALAREKVRKLGDKLAAVSGAQEAAEEKDDALTTAQAKLINEMRDQIFSLAGALDQEKRQHASAAQQLQVLQNEQSWQLPSHNDSVDASTASSFLRSSLGSSFGGGDESSFTSMSSFDSTLGGKPEFSSSVNGPGGLHTLAEEDEEEGELDLEAGPDDGAWSDEDDGVPELDFRGTQTHAEHLQKGQPGSTSSSVSLDINETRTPPPPQEPQPTHHRSDSFIKQWTFPRGKVTPLNMLEPEDHSFFSLSTAQILPPLPVSQEMLEFPNFFSSDLVVDEEERRRSLELEAHSRASSSTSTSRSSYFRNSGPPAARSAQVSAALQDGSSPGSSKSVSRMSLQGIGSLISSYVATPKDGSGGVQGMPGAMAMAGAGLCKPHTREESVFDDDHQALLKPRSEDVAHKQAQQQQQQQQHPRLVSRRGVRVQASPLHMLDFTRACGVDSNKVLRI